MTTKAIKTAIEAVETAIGQASEAHKAKRAAEKKEAGPKPTPVDAGTGEDSAGTSENGGHDQTKCCVEQKSESDGDEPAGG